MYIFTKISNWFKIYLIHKSKYRSIYFTALENILRFLEKDDSSKVSQLRQIYVTWRPR